ncbi:MAG TPA: hypothetical protein VGV38_01120, partial [Pyrinomonadaceae bacterium]|nr:hypothetical protein [Pyrinomonadaceae bacterium]
GADGKLDPSKEKIYGLARLSVNDLLQVCPVVVPPPPAKSAEPPPETSQDSDARQSRGRGKPSDDEDDPWYGWNDTWSTM